MLAHPEGSSETVQSVFHELFHMCFEWFRITEKYHSVEFSAKRGRPSSKHHSLPSRLSRSHFVDYIPPTERKSNPTRQCIIFCLKRDIKGKKVRRETRFYSPDWILCSTVFSNGSHTIKF
ncbi:hypothetical protein TNCV_906041 [Trichonephila clavipes]|nr:hypothetical protein TNCV_906041 [Trichonephila clavipes]